MSFLKKNYISEAEILDAYNLLNDKFLSIQKIFPSNYKSINLEYIVLPKSGGIFTLLNSNFIKNLTFKKNKTISFLFIFYLKFIFKLQKKNYYRHLTGEGILYDFNKSSITIDVKKEYNLFFANLESYLKVIINYFKFSTNQNNLLIVTKNISKSKILNDFDHRKIIIYEHFITETIVNKFNHSKLDFINCFNQNKIFLNDLFYIDGINFFKICYDGFYKIFSELIPEAYLNILICEEILKKLKIKNIITIRNRRVFDRSINLYFYKNKIKNYILLHSNIGNSTKFIHNMGNLNYIHGAFLWNLKQKEIIERDKNSKIDNLFIAGSPLFDKLITSNISPSFFNKYIFITAGVTNHRRFIKLTKKLISNNNEIIIKRHPNDQSNSFDNFSNSLLVHVHSNTSNIHTLIKNSFLTITDVSEASILSMMLGIPVFFFVQSRYLINLFNDIYNFKPDDVKLFYFNNYNDLLKNISIIKSNQNIYNQILNIQKKYVLKNISGQKLNNISSSIFIDKILNDNH